MHKLFTHFASVNARRPRAGSLDKEQEMPFSEKCAVARGSSVTERTNKRSAPKPIQKILVAIDFAAASRQALDRAMALANQCNGVMTVLHVIDINTQAATGTSEESMKRLWEQAFAHLGQIAGSLSGRVNAQTLLEEGLPWETITGKSRDFDLVVMGQEPVHHGWRLFSRKTVQQVLSHAACPVMIVGPEHD